MIAKVLFVLLAVGVWAADDKNYLDSIATRSTKIEGHLRCGSAPVTDAHVRLYRIASEDLNDVIGSGKTDGQGRFSVEGDTGRFQGGNSAIDPVLRIFHNVHGGEFASARAFANHQCDEEKTSSFRRVELRAPRDFVTLGRVPRRTFNIGILNLELTYPKETRQKTLEEIQQ